MKTSIILKNIKFSYRTYGSTKLTVLNNINITINSGEIVGLIGRNASGKTTLLNVMRGTLIPQYGEVRIGRINVSSNGKLFHRYPVSIISQLPGISLAPTMTVYENFIFSKGCGNIGIKWAYKSVYKESCLRLLEKANMDLENKLNEQVRFLSSGQQQTLAILLAIESLDPILLMDEPTASLDPFVAKKVIDLSISEIKRMNGLLVLVSHRIKDIIELCNRVLVLNENNITHDINENISSLTENDILSLLK